MSYLLIFMMGIPLARDYSEEYEMLPRTLTLYARCGLGFYNADIRSSPPPGWLVGICRGVSNDLGSRLPPMEEWALRALQHA